MASHTSAAKQEHGHVLALTCIPANTNKQACHQTKMFPMPGPL